jgi:exonuclease III
MPDFKRPVSAACRSISPPALRRKLSRSTDGGRELTAATPLKSDHVRIFSWNVNGVGPLLQKPLSFTSNAVTPLRDFLRRHGFPQLLCLQEVKINAKDSATQRQLELAANQGRTGDEPTYSSEFSLPRDKYNATGFGGKVHGVATLIRNDFAAAVITRKPDWDLEGRVLIHEHHSGLVIINGYWVNGTSNPYRNPNTGQVSGTRHDHKLFFHQMMLEQVLSLERKGRYIVLIGDMNVARTRNDGHPNLRTSPIQHVKNRADFNTKFFDDRNGMRGIDVFRHFHGEAKKYTYHGRGRPWGESCDRVDLAIVSSSLVNELNAVLATDICDSPMERGHSDHVPLWLRICLTTLLENTKAPKLVGA